LFALHGPPAYLRSDNGPESVALAVRGWQRSQQVQTLDSDPGCSWQNGDEERFNGMVRDTRLNSQAFASVAEAQVLCKVQTPNRRNVPVAREALERYNKHMRAAFDQ
jgi:putative transposase